ncbi:MAG TPA: DUF6152 family protein [Burkholderiaceae bacterium]|nr:DUF6152 family protein [Burkholderiaceae bacterium]
MTTRRQFVGAAGLLALSPALAHHGWSRFDTSRPLFLAGRVVAASWRNPHAEFDLELPTDAALPADLRRRRLPDQSAPIDGAQLLAQAELPRRRDRVWKVELAPLSRMRAWSVPEIKPGDVVEVLGYTFAGESGDPVLRAEYVWVGGQAYGLRSSPV